MIAPVSSLVTWLKSNSQLLRTKKLKVKCYHFFLSELHGGLHGKIIKDMGGYPEEYVPEHQSGTIPRCFMYVYIIYQHLPQIYKWNTCKYIFHTWNIWDRHDVWILPIQMVTSPHIWILNHFLYGRVSPVGFPMRCMPKVRTIPVSPVMAA